jgi:hypothetical protein
MRTLVGNQIVFTEVPPSVTIQSGPTPPEVLPSPPSPFGPYDTIMMSPTGVDIMSPTGIRLTSGTNSISVMPTGITITSAAPIEVIGLSEIKIQAPTTNIGPGVTCSINAGVVTIN